MKRILFLVAVFAITLASCSKEDNFKTVDDSVVNFSLGLENAMNTKAISDGKSVNQLMYAVFDDEGKLIIPKSVNENEHAINALHSAGG